MIKSFPFDGQVERVEEITAPGEQKVQVPVLDRAWTSAELQEFDSYFFTDGISQRITNCFKVSVSTGMKLNVAPGFALIAGARMVSDATETVTIEASDPTQARIDTVVLRKDNSVPYRECGIYVVKGTPAAVPQPVEPVRTSEVYELVIAQVKVRAGTTSIATYDISDARFNSKLCGIMAPTPGVDVTGIFDQYQAALDEFLDLVDAAISGTMLEEIETKIGEVKQKIYRYTIKANSFFETSVSGTTGKTVYNITIPIGNYIDGIKITDILEYRAGDTIITSYIPVQSDALTYQQYTELLGMNLCGRLFESGETVMLSMQAFKQPTVDIPIYIVVTTPEDKGDITI